MNLPIENCKCGSSTMEVVGLINPSGYKVECLKCKDDTGIYTTQESAILAWNVYNKSENT